MWDLQGVQLVAIVVPTLAGGLAGWQTSRRRWRSLYDEVPAGMSSTAYRRRQNRLHVLRRLFRTLLLGAIGAAIGWRSRVICEGERRP